LSSRDTDALFDVGYGHFCFSLSGSTPAFDARLRRGVRGGIGLR